MSLFCLVEAQGGKEVGDLVGRLPYEAKVNLLATVTKGEVFLVLMSMKSYKVPGPTAFRPFSSKYIGMR